MFVDKTKLNQTFKLRRMINFLNVSRIVVISKRHPLNNYTFPFFFFFKRATKLQLSWKDDVPFPSSLHQFFKKTFIPARRRLSFVDVSIRRFAFEGWISAGALQNRSREGEEVEGLSLSLSLSLFNGYPAERLAKRHNVSPFKAGPARMQRPGVDVTRIGETRSTAHANAQATKI